MSWKGLLEEYKDFLPADLTGNGLKHPNTVFDYSPIKPVQLPNDEKAVAEHIKGVVQL